MATREEVKKLAALARISISEDEMEKFTKEFEAIIAYVGQLESVQQPAASNQPPALRNVFRSDENPTPAGTWTDKLVAAFPERDGNALVVKQIISHD